MCVNADVQLGILDEGASVVVQAFEAIIVAEGSQVLDQAHRGQQEPKGRRLPYGWC